MKHFLEILREATRNKWEKGALSDYRGKTYTFAELATEISRLHYQFEQLGIRPGDKIALASKNSSHWAIAFMATISYRAVAVPILNDFTPEATEALVAHSESVLLLTEPKTWAEMHVENMPLLRAVADMDSFEPLYSVDGSFEEIHKASLREIPAVYPASERERATSYTVGELDDLIIINYTSGTTSSPKGVMLTARNISANIEFALNTIPVEEGDNIMSMLPLAHMYGLAFEFIYPLCGGGHVFFLGKTPTPTLLMQALADIKPYLLITVPLVLEKIFKNKVIPTLNKPLLRVLRAIPGINRLIYNKVRKQLLATFGGNIREIIAGGAAISLPVEKIMKHVRLPYTVGYGMTECGPLIGYSRWDSFRLGSCGRAVDKVEVRIDSTDPHKVVGEIQVRGANVMQGYYKNEEATAAAFTKDGFLRTGDLGIIDRHGNIFIKGRSKCMILTANGQNIYPEEIESRLNSMEYIAESLIVERNKHLVALVALTPDGADLQAEEAKRIVEEHRVELNQHMPAYSQVVSVEILTEGFEHTPKQSIKRFLYK
ncbi:MAG: AMP-binding protein [Alistipes sp.]|nr:AMP-binding protein [Alistipes sp.]